MDSSKQIEIRARGEIEAFPVVFVEGEEQPLIEDEELGRKLGYSDPADIKKLIERTWKNRDERPLRAIAPRRGDSSGRPRQPYFLNEKQALKVVMRSETAAADAIQDQVIAVYMAWRKGQLTPAKAEGLSKQDVVDIVRAVLDAQPRNSEGADRLIAAAQMPLRARKVDASAMQLAIKRAARALGWTFGATQARLAAALDVGSYLSLTLSRVPEAHDQLAKMVFETTKQVAEMTDAEKARTDGEKVFEHSQRLGSRKLKLVKNG